MLGTKATIFLVSNRFMTGI